MHGTDRHAQQASCTSRPLPVDTLLPVHSRSSFALFVTLRQGLGKQARSWQDSPQNPARLGNTWLRVCVCVQSDGMYSPSAEILDILKRSRQDDGIEATGGADEAPTLEHSPPSAPASRWPARSEWPARSQWPPGRTQVCRPFADLGADDENRGVCLIRHLNGDNSSTRCAGNTKLAHRAHLAY